MARGAYATRTVPVSFKKLGGGLNTTSGPLGLQDTESSNLQNIDFDKFGSFLQRNGYTVLNETAISGTPDGDGLHWFEYRAAGVRTRKALNVSGGALYKMDDLDGTWDDVTGGRTITAGNQVDFETWDNTCFMTNDTDVPWEIDSTLTTAVSGVPTGLTKAKFVVQFQNYLIYANVEVSGTRHDSRFYWSTIKNPALWNVADFFDVSVNDGQEITGIKVLGDRLVVYKTRSIHVALFTGDVDIPFVIFKSNSPVGCIAPYSIQEVDNGHVFYSHDGLYFFDGSNSYKLSDRITTTLNDMTITNAKSMYQQKKNRYWLVVREADSGDNDTVITWDSFNNSFSLYTGMNISSCAIFMVDGVDERPYFSDFAGYTYRADVPDEANDYPLNVKTAIDAFYYTNWKNFDDVVDVKRIPHTYIYHQVTQVTSILTFGYSYDFELSDQFAKTLNLISGDDTYGTGTYGTSTYSASGGKVQRQDLTGRGRVVRFKFANDNIDETFQIDGIGTLVGLETQA